MRKYSRLKKKPKNFAILCMNVFPIRVHWIKYNGNPLHKIFVGIKNAYLDNSIMCNLHSTSIIKEIKSRIKTATFQPKKNRIKTVWERFKSCLHHLLSRVVMRCGQLTSRWLQCALFQSLHDNHSDLSPASFCLCTVQLVHCTALCYGTMDNNNHLKGDFVNYYP